MKIQYQKVRHVYYTGLCPSCGRRQYVRRTDGRIGKHTPHVYTREHCAGSGEAPQSRTLRCAECRVKPVRGEITHGPECPYAPSGVRAVPSHILHPGQAVEAPVKPTADRVEI